jgi:hypothetical protein
VTKFFLVAQVCQIVGKDFGRHIECHIWKVKTVPFPEMKYLAHFVELRN